MRIPPALRPGDRLAVVAPASPFEPEAFELGLAELRVLGFEPVYDESIFARARYVAGPAEARAAALHRAWSDSTIAGIVAVRGGYGSAQLLPLLDPAVAAAHPKVLLGYSDLTTLQVWLTGRAGVVAYQGPMLEGRFARGAAGYDRDTFLRVVTMAAPAGELPAPGLETFKAGETVGPVFGGTLTQLAASLGTPWAFCPPAGHVLFLEDVSERPYRIDRLITQLRQAGILARASGVVLGTFPGCDEPGGEPTARVVLRDLLSDVDGPVLYGLPVGHVEGPALTLPLGVRARLVGGAAPAVVIEDAAVA
jgi:muramoyltetrapeptide carboxypeptidase